MAKLLTLTGGGGVDTSNDPLTLAPTDFADMSGFVPQRQYRAFNTPQGRVVTCTIPGQAKVLALTKFYNSVSTYYFALCADSTTPPIISGWKFVQGGSAVQILGPISLGIGPPIMVVATTSTVGGTVAIGTYKIRITFVNAIGETLASLGEQTVNTTTNTSVINVPSPTLATINQMGATGWNCYITQNGGATNTETLQNLSPTNIGNTFSLTAPPTNTGHGLPAVNTTTTATLASIRASLLVYESHLYVSFSGDPNEVQPFTFKFDASAVPSNWQCMPPIVAPTPGLGGGGNLSGGYYYRITGSSTVTGIETSPSPSSVIVNPSAQIVTIAGASRFQDLWPVPTFDSAQIDTINVYRIGGALSDWLLVGTTTPGATSFSDNLPDGSVTGQTMVFHRDPPPNMVGVELYKERVFGWFNSLGAESSNTTLTKPYPPQALSSSSLYYANPTEPWGFNNDQQILPISYNPTILQAGGDYGQVCKKVAGGLLLFKTEGVWPLAGEDPSSFSVDYSWPMGLVSYHAVAEGGGLVFWCSNQGVFSTDGLTPTYIGGDIQVWIDNNTTLADRQATAGFFFNQVYYLSFPTLGVTWGYWLASQKWHKLPWATDVAYYEPERSGANNAQEVVASNPSVPGEIDVWFAAETDRSQPITSTFLSKIEDNDQPEVTKAYTMLSLSAPVQPGVLVTVTMNINPGQVAPPQSQTYTFDLGLGPTQRKSISRSLQGTSLQVALSMTTNQKVRLSRLVVYGYEKREGDVASNQ
jgi:hypothetical protein